jgi:transposase
MFIKITKAKNREYVQLVRSYRKDGKVKHEVVLNFGRLDTLENQQMLKGLASSLAKAVGIGLDKSSLSGGDIFNYGYVVYKKLWKYFGLDSILSSKDITGNIDYSLNDACFLMGLTHLLNPQSKLSTYNHKDRYLGLPDVKLHNIYRSLDILANNKEKIEEELFYRKKDLFNLKLDVVFYDVTTFYFESVKKDSLKDFGFSKDNKLNEVQVVMGLLIDKEGIPVGYELFPGNTFEGKTLEVSLLKLKKRFNIDRIIVVADKGMNSKLNLKKISDMGFNYIISSRLKSLDKLTLQKVFSKDGYMRSKDYLYKKIEYLNKSKDFDIKENLIVTYSEERANMDKKKRQKLIDKAIKYSDNPSLINVSNKRGGKKYIKTTGSCSFSLDEESISKDETFDGYYAIQTNELDLEPKEIISAYSHLWKIEESFRIMKTTMEVRPIFHWTESRIKGHFVICFLSFLLERTLEFRLNEKNIEYSPDKIKEALNSMNYSEIKYNNESLFIKMNSTELSNKILKSLNIKPFKNQLSSKELTTQF